MPASGKGLYSFLHGRDHGLRKERRRFRVDVEVMFDPRHDLTDLPLLETHIGEAFHEQCPHLCTDVIVLTAFQPIVVRFSETRCMEGPPNLEMSFGGFMSFGVLSSLSAYPPRTI